MCFLEHKLAHFWLIVDQLAAHKYVDVVLDALGKNILLNFPANTSHFMQPLDDAIFSVLRSI